MSEALKQGHELKRPGNPHHIAYRCRDAEQTRWFYEDVMGLKITAALMLSEHPGTTNAREFMHLFFELGDGNFIAFFDDPDHAEGFDFKMQDGFDLHIAFEVESDEVLVEWIEAFKSHGVTAFGPIDHGFVRSIYMWDPNGYQVELTTRDAKYDEILADESSKAHVQIRDWTERTRVKKTDLFGREALEKRGDSPPA